ncbi:hypothetical protein HGA89_02085, partial [bacterium]|nr:hypothetical protein [bacterium]
MRRPTTARPAAPPPSASGTAWPTFDPRSRPDAPATLDERCHEVFSIQTAGLARRVEHTQVKRLVLGVSGGLDSTLALLVCARTLDLLARSR